jgi:hypothetical protein
MGGFQSCFSEMEKPGKGLVQRRHTKFEILMRQLSGNITFAFGDANLELQGEVMVGKLHVGESE